MNKKEILNNFLEEMSSYIFTQLRESDPVFSKKRDTLDKLENSLRERVDELDPQLWEQIEDYVAAVDDLAGEEIKAAYLHGVTDFAKIIAKTE